MHEKLVIVPKKKTGSKKMLTTAWFILACLMFLLATFVNPVIFLIPGIAFALVWYFQAFRSDIEYEYTYYDGEFRFAQTRQKANVKPSAACRWMMYLDLLQEVTEAYTNTKMTRIWHIKI